MKKEVNPTILIAAVAILVVIIGFLGYRYWSAGDDFNGQVKTATFPGHPPARGTMSGSTSPDVQRMMDQRQRMFGSGAAAARAKAMGTGQ